jgi:hypothetical protein
MRIISGEVCAQQVALGERIKQRSKLAERNKERNDEISIPQVRSGSRLHAG